MSTLHIRRKIDMRFLLIISLIFVFNNLRAGEIDGRGLVCKVYGDTIGYFFENDRTLEYKLFGGEEKLELTKKDIGKYYTNENYIYFGDVKIDRKNLKYQKYSSFRGDCEAFKNLDEFKKGFDIKSLTKGNKI
tara:strand:+ start:252 stop:650 length:399 start_codon:yes stop_codon:yes gene_type:complete